MKKISILFMTIVMLFTLSACSAESKVEKAERLIQGEWHNSIDDAGKIITIYYFEDGSFGAGADMMGQLFFPVNKGTYEIFEDKIVLSFDLGAQGTREFTYSFAKDSMSLVDQDGNEFQKVD